MGNRSVQRTQPITRGTENVFADLGFTDAVERQNKLRLAYALNRILEARKLSQAYAAKVLGVTHPRVLALRHYKLAGFSVQRLMNLFTALRGSARHTSGNCRSHFASASCPRNDDRAVGCFESKSERLDVAVGDV